MRGLLSNRGCLIKQGLQRRPPFLAALKIGTHDGAFHCDEALGCWLLKQTERFKDAEIVRTRNEEALKSLDVLIDVGCVYDPEALKFDHHQRGFFEQFRPDKRPIRLSSAGLIYRHYGMEVLESIVEEFLLTEDDFQDLYERIYYDYIEAIDAMDNGVPACRGFGRGGKGQLMFSDATGLTARVGRLNVHWRTPPTVNTDDRFAQAMELCGQDFTQFVLYVAEKWPPARKVVQEALEGAHAVSPSGQIMFLKEGCPWVKFFFALKDQYPVANNIKYCLYFESPDPGTCFVHAVPISAQSNTSKLPFPESWRGLEYAALDRVTGIDGCVFVHHAGFIAGHRTREGAMALAQKSLEMDGRNGNRHC